MEIYVKKFLYRIFWQKIQPYWRFFILFNDS